MFDDLEQQAEGLALVERDAEVAEQARASTPRWTSSRGCTARWASVVALSLDGGLGRAAASSREPGSGWCLVRAESARAGAVRASWVVNLALLTGARVSDRAPSLPEARGVAARLGLGLGPAPAAESREPVRAGARRRRAGAGPRRRVGADFVELVAEADGSEVVAAASAGGPAQAPDRAEAQASDRASAVGLAVELGLRRPRPGAARARCSWVCAYIRWMKSSSSVTSTRHWPRPPSLSARSSSRFTSAETCARRC